MISNESAPMDQADRLIKEHVKNNRFTRKLINYFSSYTVL